MELLQCDWAMKVRWPLTTPFSPTRAHTCTHTDATACRALCQPRSACISVHITRCLRFPFLHGTWPSATSCVYP
jgi:hypothetical protein